MVEDLKKDFANIKAGIEGQITDIPSAPGMEDIPAPSNEEYPEPTTISSNSQYQDITPSSDYRGSPITTQASPGADINRIHEIIERVVDEKWQDVLIKVGDIGAWKQKVDINLLGVKQEVVRLTGRLENLQGSVLGKVQDYDKGIRDIHSEMKALEKVFEKIMDPLITNVKELTKITEDLKKHKK